MRSHVVATAFALLVAAACLQRSTDAPFPKPGQNLGATPCSARVSKGPWALAIDKTSATVRFESCVAAPATLTFAPEEGGTRSHAQSTVQHAIVTLEIDTERGADLAGTFFVDEFALTHLLPSTCYAYEIDGVPDANGRFCTARAPGEPLSFAVFGDTKPALGHTQALIARIEPARPDFTLHAGDMQYYEGGSESYEFWFPAMAPMLRAGGFFPARGNHEWEEPNELEEYFRRFFHGAGAHALDDAYELSSAGLSFFVLDTESDFGPGSIQAEWLVRALDTAAAEPGHRLSIVLMHRPFVTCGDSDDHDDARVALSETFTRDHVGLVLQGHQHGYERFEIDGVTYVTTGGGGAELQDQDTNLARPYCGRRVVSGSWFEAMLFHAHDSVLEGRTIGEDGSVRDSFVVPMGGQPTRAP
jgi:hypothetical protein